MLSEELPTRVPWFKPGLLYIGQISLRHTLPSRQNLTFLDTQPVLRVHAALTNILTHPKKIFYLSHCKKNYEIPGFSLAKSSWDWDWVNC